MADVVDHHDWLRALGVLEAVPPLPVSPTPHEIEGPPVPQATKPRVRGWMLAIAALGVGGLLVVRHLARDHRPVLAGELDVERPRLRRPRRRQARAGTLGSLGAAPVLLCALAVPAAAAAASAWWASRERRAAPPHVQVPELDGLGRINVAVEKLP